MAERSGNPVARNGAAAVEAFLTEAAALPQVSAAGQGRLMMGLDATASRQPTWDEAARVQDSLFDVARGLGGLAVQLVFFRGFNEMKRTPWLSDAAALRKRMSGVECLGGHTQIARLLQYALDEQQRRRVAALVFVGDAVEEDVDTLCHLAGQMGLKGLPLFAFHEGRDRAAASCFQQLARLSGGAYAPFDANSPDRLRALLMGVVAFAAGGVAALRHRGDAGAGLLLEQLDRPR
jgi:hypothetical protein